MMEISKYNRLVWNTDLVYGSITFPTALEDNGTAILCVHDDLDLVFDNVKQIDAVIDELLKVRLLFTDGEEENS